MTSLDRTLEWMAAGEVDEAAVTEAQRKLEALLASRAPRAGSALRARGWLAAAASAAMVIMAMIWLPLTSTPALAFSAVQQNLRDFQTLRLVIDQRVDGVDTLHTRVAMTRDGNVRTEVGEDVVVIANSAERRVLTLLKSARIAHLAPLLRPIGQDDQLAWLEDIREFQGIASRLPQTRSIDGRDVHGWQLSTNGNDLVIWATDQGVPVEMTMNQGAPQQFFFHIEMNVPLAPELFSTRVPAGYSEQSRED